MSEEERLLPVVINEAGGDGKGCFSKKRAVDIAVIFGTLLSVYGFYPSTEAFVKYMATNHSDSGLGFDTDEHVLNWNILLSFSAIVINLGVTPGLLYESISGINQERQQSSLKVFLCQFVAAILSGIPMGALFLDKRLTSEDGLKYWLNRVSAYGGVPVFGFTHFLVFSGLWRDLRHFYCIVRDQGFSKYLKLRNHKHSKALSLLRYEGCLFSDVRFSLAMKLILASAVGGVFLGLTSILGFVLSAIDYADDQPNAWAGFCYFGSVMFTLMCVYLTGVYFLTVLDAITVGGGNSFAWYAFKAGLPVNELSCELYSISVLVGRLIFSVIGVLSFAPGLGGCLPQLDEWASKEEYGMSYLYYPVIIGLLIATPLFNLGSGVGVLDHLLREYILNKCLGNTSSKVSIQNSARRLDQASAFLFEVAYDTTIDDINIKYNDHSRESGLLTQYSAISG